MGLLSAEGGYRGDYGGRVAADGPEIESIACDSTTSRNRGTNLMLASAKRPVANDSLGSEETIGGQSPIRGVAAPAATNPATPPPVSGLNLGLFRHLQGVVDLDPKVPNCTFQFAKT
jgi:hypothetical protein